MELSNEQKEMLYQLVKKNFRRTVKLTEEIKSILNDTQKIIFDLYINNCSISDISTKLNLSEDEIKENLKFCVLIQTEIKRIRAEIKEMEKSGNAKSQRAVIRKEIDKFRKKMPELSDEDLEKNLSGLERRIKFLGCGFEDIMLLINIGMRLKNYGYIEKVINEVNIENLTEYQKRTIAAKERYIRVEKNANFVRDLYDKYGNNRAKIYEECEKRNRADKEILSMKFIKDEIQKYKDEKASAKAKVNYIENEK